MAETKEPTDKALVSYKVISQNGPLVLVQHPVAGRFWLVVCPYCQADISKVSIGRILQGPQGAIPDVYTPVRCPECGGGLMQQPSVLSIPPGTKLAPS